MASLPAVVMQNAYDLNDLAITEFANINFENKEVQTLFMYGFINDIDEHFSLTDIELHHMRLLTLLSLSCGSKILLYSDLLKELKVDSPAELECLLIDAIEREYLTGTLSQSKSTFTVTAIKKRRDISPTEKALIQQEFSVYLDRLKGRLHELNASLASHQTQRHEQRAAQETLEIAKKNEMARLRIQAEKEKYNSGNPFGFGAGSSSTGSMYRSNEYAEEFKRLSRGTKVRVLGSASRHNDSGSSSLSSSLNSRLQRPGSNPSNT